MKTSGTSPWTKPPVLLLIGGTLLFCAGTNFFASGAIELTAFFGIAGLVLLIGGFGSLRFRAGGKKRRR